MQKQFLEAGKIVNTHGISGEIKVQSWCDAPEVLLDFDTLYFAPEQPVHIERSYVHKGCVIMRVQGVSTYEAADALRGRVLYLDRNDIELPDDLVFVQDMLGLPVYDARTEQTIGTLKEVLPGAAHDMYVVHRAEGADVLIPACAPFLQSVDLESRQITIRSIEGLYE